VVTRILVVSCTVIAVLAAGCGGGGGGLLPVPRSNTVRQMQAGDQWTYSVTGTVTGTSAPIQVAGVLRETVTPQTAVRDGEDTKGVSWTGTISGPGYSKTLATTDYLSQDASGNIWTHGGLDTGAVYWFVTAIDVRYQRVWSPFSVGQTWGSQVTVGGHTFNIQYTVNGTGTVTVPSGIWEVYNVTGTGLFAGSSSTEEIWWAPQIGAPVQIHITSHDEATGEDLDLTLKLASRNR